MNLFKSEIDKLSFKEKILLANMKRTIAVFQNMIGHAPEVEMWDDQQCRTALNKLPMKEAHGLADDFDKEEVGMIKSDLCRLVMLYNTGGYYFDTDIAPLAALQKALDPRATFVTVKTSGKSGGGRGFFQAFMATTPRHPVIKIAMLNLVLISLPLGPFAINVLVSFGQIFALPTIATGLYQKMEATSSHGVNLSECFYVWFSASTQLAGQLYDVAHASIIGIFGYFCSLELSVHMLPIFWSR